MTSPRHETFKKLTQDEIKELSWRGRAVMKKIRGRLSAVIGSVFIELLTDPDGMVVDPWSVDNNYGMGIYWVYGDSGRVADCHIEDWNGELESEGDEFAARRALKVLREHMVLDDLAAL